MQRGFGAYNFRVHSTAIFMKVRSMHYSLLRDGLGSRPSRFCEPVGLATQRRLPQRRSLVLAEELEDETCPKP